MKAISNPGMQKSLLLEGGDIRGFTPEIKLSLAFQIKL